MIAVYGGKSDVSQIHLLDVCGDDLSSGRPATVDVFICGKRNPYHRWLTPIAPGYGVSIDREYVIQDVNKVQVGKVCKKCLKKAL